MSVWVLCASCGFRVEADDDFKGRKKQCPQCGVYCELPEPAATGSTPKRQGPAREPVDTPAPPPKPPLRRAGPAPARAAPDPPGATRKPVSEPPPQRRPAAQAPAWDDEDDEPPPSVQEERFTCPNCQQLLLLDTGVCTGCKFRIPETQIRRRPKTKLSRTWETWWPYAKRMRTFLLLQGVYVPLAILVAWWDADYLYVFFAWTLFTAMTSFLLGSFDRLDLERNKRGQIRLTQTWRYFFVLRFPQEIPWREYEGVTTGMHREVGFLDWIVAGCLFCSGIIPGIIWWYLMIHRDAYFVALTRDHGFPELYLYKGKDQEHMTDIADTVSDVTGLPWDRG